MMNSIPIYIIIVTYNGAKWLEKCISSALASDIPVKLVIIDNGSSDSTLNIIHQFPQENIHLIVANSNLGFGRANNLGIEYAIEKGAKYVYLLNQDAYLEPDTISILVRASTKYRNYGILSPIQLNGGGTELDKNFAMNCSADHCKGLISDLLLNSIKDIYEIDFIMAAHWLVNIDMFLRIGLFGELFAHYGEDNDLINRIQYSGYKIGICPTSKAMHDREFRKLTFQKISYNTFTAALVNLSNIKNKFTKVFFSFTVFIKEEILLSIKFKSLRPLTYIFILLYKVPAIINHRKKSKSIIECK